jgi:pyruvate dehydrogenase E2 component (dihydrolipoamide acetyltransferase)
VASEIYMPQLGLTMTEGIVVHWLVSAGQAVAKGEPVLEIETDKVTAEIEAPAAGVIAPGLIAEGTRVPIGGVLGYVLAAGESAPVAAPAGSGAPGIAAVPAAVPASALPATRPEAPRKAPASPRARRWAEKQGVDLAQVTGSGPGGRIVEADVQWSAQSAEPHASLPAGAVAAHMPHEPPEPAALRLRSGLVSPIARRVADELGVDLASVQGTGPGGRILEEDVRRTAPQTAVSPSVESETSSQVPPFSAAVGLRRERSAERPVGEPLTGIRKVVAERMAHSFATVPHFYLSVEAQAGALVRLRQQLLPQVEKKTGVRLTITDLLIRVAGQALAEFPAFNATWVECGDGGVLRQADANVGVAVSLENGLVVPVIHQADRLSLSEIARQRADLAARARAGKLALPELEGGAFTLSNLGMYRIDSFQAIINTPQSAILAVGRIADRPYVVDGALTVCATMHLTLSLDHRLVDGSQGALFLGRIVELIENPQLLLG